MHENHRKRLDEKFIRFGLEGLEEHEQLEFLLFAVIPRRDTNALAHRLLDKYGTFGGVLTAEVEDLETVEGVGHRTAVFLHSLPEIGGAIQRGLMKRPVEFNCFEDLTEYLQTFFLGKLSEEAYMFCLNASNKLISFSKMSKGVGGETPIYPTHIVKRAVLDDANKVIIAHNHPFGDSKPSGQDVELGRRLMAALEAVDIELVDSIIVARGECYSLKRHGYLASKNGKY